MSQIAKPKVGDWVEVRTKEEILRTLDAEGKLDGMPFMPEMFRFCGQRFQLYKRAHKTCDTVFPIRGRKLERSVHLETLCDGQAHGGCEAGCLLFWKEAWLKRIDDPETLSPVYKDGDKLKASPPARCTEAHVWANVTAAQSPSDDPVYTCQATQLPYFTTELHWWDIRQYVEDYRSGNVGLWRMICGLVYSMYYHLSEAGIGLGRPMRWLYDKAHPLWRGSLFPTKKGEIPVGQPTPASPLNLQPGELVRVKPHQEILKTVDTSGRNRGMTWDSELVPYCDGTYRVLKRVKNILNEQTGRMQKMKNPCIMLESVVCQARYSKCRMFCPRSIHSYWREIWLERVAPAKSTATRSESDELVDVIPDCPVHAGAAQGSEGPPAP